MLIKSAIFKLSAPELKLCPKSDLPEFAFIGRSNVGKSSLINMLCNKKGLAKTSSTPGKTKLINFFTINEFWSLVDLPGYGYAKVAKTDRKEFNKAVTDYIIKRDNLYCVFVLIDVRHEPQPMDLEFINWIGQHEIPFVLVFTKTDKLSPTQAKSKVDLFLTTLRQWWDDLPKVFTSSITTKSGKEEILDFIEKTLAKK
jgi:GTP-binding protein